MAITAKKDACFFCEKKRIKKQNRDVSTAINKRALGGMLIPYYVGRLGQIGKFCPEIKTMTHFRFKV